MGTWKTSVGCALTRRLGIPFVDSDKEIEAVAGFSKLDMFSKYAETKISLRGTTYNRVPVEYAETLWI